MEAEDYLKMSKNINDEVFVNLLDKERIFKIHKKKTWYLVLRIKIYMQLMLQLFLISYFKLHPVLFIVKIKVRFISMIESLMPWKI